MGSPADDRCSLVVWHMHGRLKDGLASHTSADQGVIRQQSLYGFIVGWLQRKTKSDDNEGASRLSRSFRVRTAGGSAGRHVPMIRHAAGDASNRCVPGITGRKGRSDVGSLRRRKGETKVGGHATVTTPAPTASRQSSF